MDQKNFYDVVVIGGGPAGLTAALYLARACYRVLVVEKEQFGGQITITSEVVNYPGVARTSGTELTRTMREQAQKFGAEFLLAEAERVETDSDIKKVFTSRGGEFSCFGILCAAGARPRMVGFRGEEEFRGHGVAYCATCDGEFFTGKDVFVVGGGFAAAEESVFLTRYARHVTILIRGAGFSCAEATAEAARNHEKITVLTHTQVEAVEGDQALRVLRYKNTETQEVTEYRARDGETFGVFVFAGYEPATELLRGIADLNEQGYVITDRNQKTNVDGLYAAGDICVKSLRQVVTAVGDGAVAAAELEKYAAAMQQKTGLRPVFPMHKETEGGSVDPGHEGAGTVPKDPERPAAERHTGVFSEDIVTQLKTVFARMERPLTLRLVLDDRPVSAELEQYVREMASYTDKLAVEITEDAGETHLPVVRVYREDGADTGLAFHGVPGGHEFTSFILGLYNASGPGQMVDQETMERIHSLRKPVDLKILVSLSCTMCPELVTAAQRVAAESPLVRAEVYDLNHFEDLKEKYQVMSVPCLVIDGSRIFFGKKNVRQLLDLIGQRSE